MKWADNLGEQAKKEINDEILLERFEEILFEEGSKLVHTDDEKLTIKYPFMMRIDDLVNDEKHPESKVIKREIINENDTYFFNVTLLEVESGKTWSTKFEVPE